MAQSANHRAFQADKLTLEKLVNTIFSPAEQVNGEQSHLLDTTHQLLSGGSATPHVGTGSGGSTSDLRWNGKDPNDRSRPKRR